MTCSVACRVCRRRQPEPRCASQRYAVLVLDEQRGALIREVAPPAK
jgi:hypothetical protein